MGVAFYPIGDNELRIVVDEADAGPDSEIVIELPFRKGQLLRHKSIATGGDGPGVRELQSFLARSAGAPLGDPVALLDVEFRAQKEAELAPGEVVLDVQPTWPVLMYCGTPAEGFTSNEQGRLYFRPTPDVEGVTLAAEFILRRGWPPSVGSA